MDETHADIENVLHRMSRIFVDRTLEKYIKRSEDMAILESKLYFERECLIKKEEELVRLNKLLADGEATCTFLLKANSELEEELEELKANFNAEKEKSAKQEQDLVELQDLVKLRDGVELQLEDLVECSRYFVDVLAENKMTIETLKSDLDRAETDLKDEKENMLCPICMDRPRNALCMPCKHLGYCITCLQEHMRQSQTCPTCRSPNQEILECYI